MIQNDEHVCKLRFHYNEPKHFLKEFSTVKICGPRRSGHSSCIPKIIFKYRLNPLVLSFNIAMSERLATNFVNNVSKFSYDAKICKYTKSDCVYRYDGVDNDYKIDFSSINCLCNGSLNGLSCDSIIIDTASMLKSNQIEMIYDWFSASIKFIPNEKNPLVIFLE